MTGLQTKLNVLSNLPVAGWTKNSVLPAAETTSEIKGKTTYQLLLGKEKTYTQRKLL